MNNNKPFNTSYHIANYLGTGAKNIKKTATLQKELGGVSIGTIKQFVRHDRSLGAWIVSQFSNGGGYYLAESEAEYTAFCGRYIKSGGKTAARFRSFGEHDIEGQIEFNYGKEEL